MISRMRQRRVVRDQLVRADWTTRHLLGVFNERLPSGFDRRGCSNHRIHRDHHLRHPLRVGIDHLVVHRGNAPALKLCMAQRVDDSPGPVDLGVRGAECVIRQLDLAGLNR